MMRVRKYFMSGFICLPLVAMSACQKTEPNVAPIAAKPLPASPQPMTAVDMVEIKRLANPSLSPNGRYLLYTASYTDWKANKNINRYRIRDLESGEPLSLFKAENSKESHGRAYWAPDSAGFITILKRKDDDYKQAYFYDLSQGSLSRLTDHDSNIEKIEWAPNGSGFYFVSKALQPKHIVKARKKDWLIQEYETRDNKEIWYFDREQNKARQIVSGAFYIRGYDLSDDGTKLLYMRAPGGMGDDQHDGELWLHNFASGEQTQLTRNGYAESQGQLSPDNSQFAYIATVNERGDPYYEDNLFVHRIGESAPNLILPDLPMEIEAFQWSQTSDGLFIVGNTGLRSNLYYYRLDDQVLEQLTSGDHAVKSWSYNSDLGLHIFKKDSAENPGEILSFSEDLIEARQLTQEYKDFSKRYALPQQTVFHWTARDGQKLEGLLVFPIGYQSGEAFPLVTITHGGPRSSAQFGAWNDSRYVPVFAGQGYGVFLPNHRGGTGYGDAFMRDMVGNYFRNAQTDVLDGIDALIAQGFADPNRLIKHGWSAGGHMTNKLITITDRFKAASSGAGASDWDSMYGESDIRHNRRPWFGGAPWEKDAPLEAFNSQSVLKDAWKIKTPTLFWAGENDERVPPTQSILIYRGAKAAGADVELYIAEDEPHNFKEPRHKLFKINKELAWYAERLDDVNYNPVWPEDHKDMFVGDSRD